ncbi:MAG: hypothetical protein IJH91_00465 [Mogibacterium sp.]|nr:hypothetical protein [Mogibacterium sp.]
MLIRNGINSIIRERARTALFSLLIIFLTVTMILSISVLLYCNAVMESCDEAYRSIALIEYMGSEYPNQDEPDAAARAAAEALSDDDILAVPGVTAWTRGSTATAAAEGYERRFGKIPYGNRGVLVVSRVSQPVYQGTKLDASGKPIITEDSFFYHTCFLKTALYSRSVNEGIIIDIIDGSGLFEPEPGKSYVLNGSFLDVSRSARELGDYPKNGLPIFLVESFIATDELPYAEYVEGTEIPERFLSAADQYRVMNNYIRVVPCRDVNDVYVFQQNDLHLAAGEMPDPGAPNACVVSADLAEALDLEPGDVFTLEDLQSTDNDRYDLISTGNMHSYTVTGIVEASFDYCGTIWVIAEDADTPLFGYLLGTVSLDNKSAEAAAETLQEIVPDQVRVTLLDQGYGATVLPFQEIRSTAVNVLLICSAGVVAVLLLFAFLFVGRQSDTVRIMVSLGTPGRKIALWFLSGALVVCGISVVIGVVLGMLLRPAAFHMISKIAAVGAEEALRYSETSLGIMKQTSFDPQIPLWPDLLAALGIVALALLFSLFFLRLARRGGTRKRGKSRVRVPHGLTTVHGEGGLRFALLSIRRGGLRSLVVPLVSMMLTVAVLVLSGVYQTWQDELDNALEETRIDGMVVSLDGRYYSGLAMPMDAVQTLLDTEGVENVSVSFGYRYWLPEDMPPFKDSEGGWYLRQSWIAAQPDLIALNSLSAAKGFYYADPAVTWLEGWDESMLSETDMTPIHLPTPHGKERGTIPAVCSTEFLEKHGLRLGDTFDCMAQYKRVGYAPMEFSVTLQAVGSYVQQGGKANVYAPLSCYIRKDQWEGSAVPDETSEKPPSRADALLTFRTCRFYLTSARELDAVRKRLWEQGFSAVGNMRKNRTTVLLRDAEFLKLTENMKRNITMGRVMSTVISLLIMLLGFIISWLMTFSRRREFALMRGFGAQKRRVFASFFLEQAILSVAGCLVGCAALFRLYVGGVTQPLAVVAYLICYLLGAAVSIRMVGKTDLMELLTIRD